MILFCHLFFHSIVSIIGHSLLSIGLFEAGLHWFKSLHILACILLTHSNHSAHDHCSMQTALLPPLPPPPPPPDGVEVVAVSELFKNLSALCLNFSSL